MKDYVTSLLLLQAGNGLVKVWHKELSRYGISPEQAAVLFIIQSIGHSPSLTEISRWTLREVHSVSELLSRMERQGLVTKAKKSNRKNLVTVAITEKGQKAYYQAAKIKSIHRIVSQLSVHEQKELNSHLLKLRAVGLKELGVEWQLPFLSHVK